DRCSKERRLDRLRLAAPGRKPSAETPLVRLDEGRAQLGGTLLPVVQQLRDTIEVLEREGCLDRFHEGQLHPSVPAAEHGSPGAHFLRCCKGFQCPTLGPSYRRPRVCL